MLAPLVAERKTGAEMRFWVPACASGEEAYSLAMLALERAEAACKQFDVKIFATDPQEDNLRAAREGIYPAAAAETISPERLRRFFNTLDNSYQIKKELRERVVFAQHNLLSDPPFSRLDLISCRNLLIYLDGQAQARVMALFHFALREGGALFLGNAETIGRNDELFEQVSKKWRIYRRLGPTRHDILDFPVLGKPVRSQGGEVLAQPDPEPSARAADVARRALLERYAPASVLIDQKGRILYFHGPTGDYLQQPTGEPTRDVVAMARLGLRARLRSAVRQAIDTAESVTFAARIHQDDAVRPTSVTVAPLAAPGRPSGLLLISFEPTPELRSTACALPEDAEDGAASTRALEEELRSTRTELQTTIQQMESANEELKAANEEVTSINEELQSTNEELETSKEELQSYNEELHTINSELQNKILELETLSDNLDNLLNSTDIATVFLDTDLHINWFSPGSKDLLDLLPSDIGRPIGHFALKFADADLLRDAATVLDKLIRIEAEVRSNVGRWYLRRMLPYRTRDDRIAGVVVTFVDITERKQTADAINEARIYAETIVETIRQPLLVLDSELRIRSANRAFHKLFAVSATETENSLLYELGNRQWDIPPLRSLLDEVLRTDAKIDDFSVEHDFPGLGRRTMLLGARRIPGDSGRENSDPARHRGRHRANPHRGATAARRRPRRADRPAQSPRVRTAPAAGRAERPAARFATRALLLRSGPVQAHQRHRRSRRRRRVAAAGTGTVDRQVPRAGYACPAGRGRVCASLGEMHSIRSEPHCRDHRCRLSGVALRLGGPLLSGRRERRRRCHHRPIRECGSSLEPSRRGVLHGERERTKPSNCIRRRALAASRANLRRRDVETGARAEPLPPIRPADRFVGGGPQCSTAPLRDPDPAAGR